MAIMIPLCKEYCEKRKKLVSTPASSYASY